MVPFFTQLALLNTQYNVNEFEGLIQIQNMVYADIPRD